MRRIVGGKPELPKDAVNVVLNSRLLMRGLKDYFNDRNGVPRKLAELNLDAMCEQVPDADSRVTLSERRDQLSMRLPRVDWRSHSEESRCMRRMAELVAGQLHHLGLPRPALADWVLDKAEIPTSFVDVAHPSGTTRMSDDPVRGVVDANCEVHGVCGLFVSGSSVFPTAGHCNPTQMIVAMAVRLADHLKTQDARAAPTRVMIDAGSAGR
jgi:choline dehydrogenase-like flavoprotein